MRCFTWLFLLLILGCAARPQDKEADPNVGSDRTEPLKNLEAQAEEVGRAAVEEDHPKMAELTLPALVEKFGGRTMYVKKLESIAAEMKGQGFRIKQVAIGKPSQLVQAGGETYAVVPSEPELSGPGGATGKKRSYMIAVSQDGGATWKFIDGAGIGSDRGKLKSILPNFPEELQLPDATPAVWDKHPDKSVRPPGPTKAFARPVFTFDYPAAWTVKETDKDYDPDHLFSIDASAGAFIMFVIADRELDPSKVLEVNLRAQGKRMTITEKTEFTSWGQYRGQGAMFRWKFLAFVPETVRVFVFNDGGKTFTLTEGFPDDEEKQLAPGYKTIEDSFRVLQAGKGEAEKAVPQDK
jgi:hypothetical protein